MSEDQAFPPSIGSLDSLVPSGAISLSVARKSLDKAQTLVSRTAEKATNHLRQSLHEVAQTGAGLELRALQPIASRLGAAEDLLGQHVTTIHSDLGARLAVARAALTPAPSTQTPVPQSTPVPEAPPPAIQPTATTCKGNWRVDRSKWSWYKQSDHIPGAMDYWTSPYPDNLVQGNGGPLWDGNVNQLVQGQIYSYCISAVRQGAPDQGLIFFTPLDNIRVAAWDPNPLNWLGPSESISQVLGGPYATLQEGQTDLDNCICEPLPTAPGECPSQVGGWYCVARRTPEGQTVCDCEYIAPGQCCPADAIWCVGGIDQPLTQEECAAKCQQLCTPVPPPPPPPECCITSADLDRLCQCLCDCLRSLKLEQNVDTYNETAWLGEDASSEVTDPMQQWYGDVWDQVLGQPDMPSMWEGFAENLSIPQWLGSVDLAHAKEWS